MTEHELMVFSPELPNTPGWLQLSREKQEWLLKRTSNLIQFRRMEGLGAVGACIELVAIERELAGGPLTMTNYMRTVFGQSERTAWRRLADFKELRTHWPEKVIETVASKGATLLRGASGIGLKELINVAKELPAPTSKEEKIIEGYVLKDVRDKMRQQRQKRREGVTLTWTEEEAAKIAVNYLIRAIRLAGLKTSADKRKWLIRVVGWAMEAQAVPGALKIVRTPIPAGTIIRRGRPRKKIA